MLQRTLRHIVLFLFTSMIHSYILRRHTSRSFIMQTISTNIKLLNVRGKPKGYANASLRYTLNRHTLSGLPNTSIYKVLGIESSCDDTGVAIVQSDGKILANVVYSQYSIHQKFGGIVPKLAMAAHQTNIDIALEEAISKAGLQSIHDVDAIAVTKGPGLEICLRVGLEKAKSLAVEYNKPLVYAHHLEGHCLMARLSGENTMIPQTSTTSSSSAFQPKIQYPFLALIASGGHTSLIICKGLGEYDVLGGTRDDALGEAFDKAARLLGLQSSSSGGAAIEKLARQGNPNLYPMTIPMKSIRSCDFSYAGLKTSFRILVEKAREVAGTSSTFSNAPTEALQPVEEFITLPDKVTSDLCASFQKVAIAHVIDRVNIALDYVNKKNIKLNGFTVVGGVASNTYLRSKLMELAEFRYNTRRDAIPLPLIFPPTSLCTDNGVMPAWAGIEKLSLGISDSVDDNETVSRWPLGTLIQQ